MTLSVVFETAELRQLKSVLDGLPREIKEKALNRALRRVQSMAKTQIVRRSSQKVNVQQRYIRPVVTPKMISGSGGELEFIVRSGWVRLQDMGPTVGENGVSVKFLRKRADYAHAFIAMLKGRESVLMRAENGQGGLVGRYPIMEMHAANIANAIHNDTAYFEQVLTDIITERLQRKHSPRTAGSAFLSRSAPPLCR